MPSPGSPPSAQRSALGAMLSPICGDDSVPGSPAARRLRSPFLSGTPTQQTTRSPPPASSLAASAVQEFGDAHSSSDDGEDEEGGAAVGLALSPPFRLRQLRADWVASWAGRWGLSGMSAADMSMASEQRCRERLRTLTARRAEAMPAHVVIQERAASAQISGPSILAAVARPQRAFDPGGRDRDGLAVPGGQRSPAKSPHATLSPCGGMGSPVDKMDRQDQSMASAEKTKVKKSKWLFGDHSDSEDEWDRKMGFLEGDDEEPWESCVRLRQRGQIKTCPPSI